MVVDPDKLAALAEELAKMAQGWAVATEEGGILVGTISSTERGAKMNWLWAHVGLDVKKSWTDAQVEEEFSLYAEKPAYRARVLRVVVQEMPEVPPSPAKEEQQET